MNIFLDNGYLDFNKILACNCPFIFIIGGRGTGKTYGAIKYCVDNNIEFIFLRRTQIQLEMIKRPEFSPFEALNVKEGYSLETKPMAKNASYIKNKDKVLGNMLALSTISNLRGFHSMARVMIYDEFIPEKHEKPIKGEASAFFNAYETINRNRELDGIEPLQVICLSNSNDLDNPILEELNLINLIEKKKRKGQTEYINHDRGIAIFLLDESVISQKKKETVLYKLTKGTSFYEMAVDNTFTGAAPENVNSEPIEEYNPVAELDGFFVVYKHKSEKKYYISNHRKGSPKIYQNTNVDVKRFKVKHNYLKNYRMKNKIIFESYNLQLKFDNLYNM